VSIGATRELDATRIPIVPELEKAYSVRDGHVDHAGFTDLAQPSQRLHSLRTVEATLSSPVRDRSTLRLHQRMEGELCRRSN